MKERQQHNAYECGLVFYNRKIIETQGKLSQETDKASYSYICSLDQLEDYKLKLAQLKRRRGLGFI